MGPGSERELIISGSSNCCLGKFSGEPFPEKDSEVCEKFHPITDTLILDKVLECAVAGQFHMFVEATDCLLDLQEECNPVDTLGYLSGF